MPRLVEGYAHQLVVPAGARDVQVFDDELPGFGIRKFSSGRASYFVKYAVGAQQRRHTLGAVVRGNLKAMRLEASRVLAKARLGQDVAVEKAVRTKRVVTLGELVPAYLKARESELRSRTYTEWKRYLQDHWAPLHDLPVDAITRADVVGVMDNIEQRGMVAADRARTALSAFFAWAIDRGHCGSNPTMNIRSRNQNGSRTRVLTEAELAEIWKACLPDDHGRIVRLLILTGQRRREIGDLVWSEIDVLKRQINLPDTRTKNRRWHIVPLSNEALAVIESIPRRDGRDRLFGRGADGFSGWSKAKAELNARIAAARVEAQPSAESMPSWTLHDLRRSFVTHLNERKLAPPHVIEAVVNHVSGHLAGVAGVYNKALYLAERRQALDLWSEHVLTSSKIASAQLCRSSVQRDEKDISHRRDGCP